MADVIDTTEIKDVAPTLVRRQAMTYARSLSAWARMDIALVGRQGSMAVGGAYPRGQTGMLVDLEILKRAQSRDEFGRTSWALVPGPKFGAVKQALTDLAKAKAGGEA